MNSCCTLSWSQTCPNQHEGCLSPTRRARITQTSSASKPDSPPATLSEVRKQSPVRKSTRRPFACRARRGDGGCVGPRGRDDILQVDNEATTKPLVKKFNGRLQGDGLRTWLDDEEIEGGKLIEVLSEAIRKASIVILCYSSEYFKSPNCALGVRHQQGDSLRECIARL